ncbi:MAG: VWA domain-containing protein [Acidobacteriota bacterium]
MLLASLLLMLGQQNPPQPAFTSGVNLVEVDVLVSDTSGRPVRGLGRDDFDILEDGTPVEVATFTAVDLPGAAADAPIPSADRSGSSIASNGQADDGRVILIVLDDYHVDFAAGKIATVRAVAMRVVERLGPSDQAAIISTSGRRTEQAEFTTDKGRLAAAIDAFFPQSGSEAGSRASAAKGVRGGDLSGRFGFIKELQASWTADALSNAAKALATIPHRRKAMLLVSQGLPVSLDELMDNRRASSAAQTAADFILTAQRSNIAVYTVDPCGLEDSFNCTPEQRNNLRGIAEGTGGFAVLNTNDPAAGVDRMVEENGVYYLIGYRSPAPPNNGKRHRITVRTRSSDYKVRVRQGYVAPRKSSVPAVSAPLQALVSAAIQTRGLTMRLAAVPTPLPVRRGSAVAVSIDLLSTDVTGHDSFEVSVVAVDHDGKVRAERHLRSAFAGVPPRVGGWTTVTTRLDLPKGEYQIRAAGVAAGGVRGSVFTELAVPAFTGNLSLGGLSLGFAAAPTTGPGQAIGDLLPLIPMATGDLRADAQFIAQIPIRVGPKATGPLTVTAMLLPSDGAPAQLAASSSPAADYAGVSGGVYQVSIPGTLPAGSYRLSIGVVLGRSRASRDMPFTIGR